MPGVGAKKLTPTHFPGGKSGLHRAGCQVTPGRREPTESATENIPPAPPVPVRVKWCGKSAPRVWQQTWQGKPHPEQDQIGERSCGPHGSRVGCLRCAVTRIPEEWLSTTEPGLSAGSLINWFEFATEVHGMTRKNSMYQPADAPRGGGKRLKIETPLPGESVLIGRH
jgi:hypothetical protein